ncbi:RNA polymerase sigma factor [Paremcibacter congregatus]|uniref:RNA polymerase subunit sigma-70 n=1 Tax=Paremcibacter congregatus TaxID=2043170 RepID=A0A2G4YR11_9PROT|nr:sigma-70 family RNA polymerase sigma factor [Paremcibacter congregatus]PHZ84762.1 hypothetical protein CRD36_10785 [Paremcibacter congregatus]QDE28954.1 sigma-70 family RNA polymerase sigma factor [Paremcibacter congregatus]
MSRPQHTPPPEAEEVRTSILTQLVAKYHRALMRYFWASTRDHGAAEDLTQEVYYRLSRFQDPAALAQTEGYLFKIASNLLKNKWRDDGVRRRVLHVEYDDGLERATPQGYGGLGAVVQNIDDRDQCRYLLKVLNGFPPKTRDVFLLARFEGMSYHEISQHCGMSTHMVKKHMMKAIAQVKVAMECYG